MRNSRRDFKIVFLGAFLALAFIFVLNNSAQAQNGSLYLSPSSGNVSVGQTFSIVLRVNTGGTAINAAEGSIVFDQQKFSVTSVSKSGSIFSIWASEPKFSNAEGTIDFAAGVPNPGYSGSNGLVLTVNFMAKAATTVRGYTEILLVSGAILANDGQGTNILASLGKATYFVGAAAAGPEQKPVSVPKASMVPVVGQAMTITSPTHSDQSKWYSNKNPLFKWDLPSGVQEVILVLSKRENSPPIISYVPPISEKILNDLEDGTWYLNGRLRTLAGLGPITSFKFNIDTQPPKDFNVVRLDADDPTNPRPQLSFESSDELSGIDHYEMRIGEGEWFSISPGLFGKPYELPLQVSGTRAVWVKAIDKAGNSTSSKTEVVINPIPIPAPIIKEVILPGIGADKVVIIKVVKEVVVKEVVVKGLIAKEVVVKEGVIVKVAAIVVNVLKLESSNSFGQISGSVKDAEEKLIKTVEVPVDEKGNFEAKINELEAGTYIIRTYGKDERGVISDAFSDVILKVAGKSIFAKFATWVSGAILSGFESLVNFLNKGWFLIAAGILIIVTTALIMKRIVPFLMGEIRKIRYIASEYRALKQLKKLDNKTRVELKLLRDDLKRELDLLNRIENHRRLHSDEQYLKNKLENYHNLLKNMKG